jgi:DNA-binding response OmpR family regulator
MDQVMKQILVIEDDPDIGDMLGLNLRDEGFAVEIAANGYDGLNLLKSKAYDLLILDLMLPRIDGLDVCREVRRMPDYLPIIMLSARSAETQRIIGLELGADDYLTKPFSLYELLARIRALFRRVAASDRSALEKTGVISCGELYINPLAREVTLSKKALALTVKEFDLLLFFARNPGKTFTRLALLDEVWGYSHDGYEHTVNSHINRLRAKIERDSTQPKLIQTVWGIGYKFADIPRNEL